MMSTLTATPVWTPIGNLNGTDENQPWFFTQSYGMTKHVIDCTRTDSETLCAEILSSLSEIISSQSDSDSDQSDDGSFYSPKHRDFTSFQKKSMKFSKQRKDKVMKSIRFKRNVNACAEHRRKHQVTFRAFDCFPIHRVIVDANPITHTFI
jgi:hypothetical protein